MFFSKPLRRHDSSCQGTINTSEIKIYEESHKVEITKFLTLSKQSGNIAVQGQPPTGKKKKVRKTKKKNEHLQFIIITLASSVAPKRERGSAGPVLNTG